MTEEERQELVAARGAAMAALLCVQQLVRVLLEGKVLAPHQAQDAISEALAMAATLKSERPIDAAVNAEVQRMIIAAFRN